MSGGGGTQNSVSKFEPPEWTQQGWKNSVNAAGQLANTPYQQYAGMTIAPLNQQQRAAQDMIYQTATLGGPDTNAGRGAFTNIANGQYLNSNPYVQQNSAYTKQVMQDNANNMATAFANGTAAQNDALFARQGAFGGSAWQQKQTQDATALANQVGQMGNQYNMQRSALGAQDYQSGVNQMLQGAQGAVQGQGLDLAAGNALWNSGQAQQDYANKLLGANYNEYQQQMNYPQTQLQNYLNALTQASGGQGTQTVSGGQNSPWANILGAGLGAAGAYNLFRSP